MAKPVMKPAVVRVFQTTMPSVEWLNTVNTIMATRLPHPWDSPGKNTGVGCHFLLQCVKVKSISRVRLLATPWTAAYQAPPSMGFSRQEYWIGVSLLSPLFPATYLCKTRFSSFTSTKTTLSNKLKAEADMDIPLSAIKPKIYKNIKQLTLSSIIYINIQ